MKQLHWLPIESRIRFKINLITWKALNGLAPTYIKDLLHEPDVASGLRSINNKLLYIPKVESSMGDRAFSRSAPEEWNKLPVLLRNAPTLAKFKSGLKTYLFTEAYN
jgi:hypothetical protein